MYLKHPDSITLELQGVIVNIPPVGYIYNHFLKEWEHAGVRSRSSKKSEQYWEPERLPDWYNKKRREEERIIISTGNHDYVIPECEEIRQSWWIKRLGGEWFMNNGVATYVSPTHWFYLTCYSIDVGLPKYFDYDRKRFYHLDYCNQDPFCYGRVEIGPRRMGKTYMGSCFIYEAVSRTSFANGGIQSKTNGDGKKVFLKGLVSPFRKLPHFFIPTFDKSSGTIPKSEIRFFHTSKKGNSVSIDDFEPELESIIDFRSSDTYAYDGEKLLRILHDEVFKTSECDVYDRWNVVKECLVDNTTEEIIGKGFLTSTVEEVEGYLERYEKLWNDSDPEQRDKNGHTVSGLYRYFISALETRGVDKYGNADEKKNIETIQNKIDSLRGDAKALSDYKRKYPISIRDAFRPKASDCHYDIEKLMARHDVLSVIPPKYKVGDLKWVNPDDIAEGVKFVEKKNGNFKIHNDLDLGDPNLWNQVRINGSKPRPTNSARYTGGNDPFDNKTTVDGRKSNGSTIIFKKYDSMNPMISDKPVLVYNFRPKKPSIFYEDTLKIAWFFGCKILIEDNKKGIIQYFEWANPHDMDFSEFMVQLPDRKEPGIPATVHSHENLVNHTAEYVDDCCEQIDFIEIIEDLIGFDINKTTKFDVAMSFGYSLISANRFLPKVEKEKKEEYLDIHDLFQTY